MRYLGIIPARYASTRFPGKLLADLCGHPVIEHVYRRVASVLDDVYVATDDERIASVVRSFGGNAVMTSSLHRCGTERCGEAFGLIGSGADVVIDIQGDEPFIDPDEIRNLTACMESADHPDIATSAHCISPADRVSVFADCNRTKVRVGNDMYAVSFHRALDPDMSGSENVYQHIGIYAFRSAVLPQLIGLPPSPLEHRYSLEQYRWLEHGYRMRVGICSASGSIAIDTPADLEVARKYYIEHCSVN